MGIQFQLIQHFVNHLSILLKFYFIAANFVKIINEEFLHAQIMISRLFFNEIASNFLTN